MLVNFIVKYFWFCLIIVVFLTTELFCLSSKEIFIQCFSFFFFTFIIWWTLSQLVVSFACFIMWSCSSLTLIPCVQCVCVCMCEAEHVSFLFFPLSQSSLDHTEFKRCGPFDPYINAKVCTHDLWPARFTSICHAWVCLVSVGTVSLHSFSCLWLII